MTVVVVTDSAACLDPDVAEELGIRVVPLHVLVDGDALREGVDEIPAPAGHAPMTTSAASPGEMRIAYTRALAASDGDGVVAVHLSRLLSSTWEAGRQAAGELGDQVRVIDSCSAGMGTGFAVLAAARAARAGAGLDDVYDTAVAVAERTLGWVVVDRVDELRRGGRFDAQNRRVASVLASRPLLRLAEGKLELEDKVRTSSKAIAKLAELAAGAVGEDDAAVAVQHVDAADRAERLAGQLRKRIPQIGELVVREFGPTLAVHLGHGAVGVLVVPGGCESERA